MTESSQARGPVIFKCKAGIINFSFPVAWAGEKIYIVGRGGFASYEDLLEFLKLVKTNNLPSLPATMPLDFSGEDHVRAIAQYVFLTITRLLVSFDEKYRLEE